MNEIVNGVTIQMKATEQYFPVILFLFICVCVFFFNLLKAWSNWEWFYSGTKKNEMKPKVSYHIMTKHFAGSIHLLNFAYNHAALYTVREISFPSEL